MKITIISPVQHDGKDLDIGDTPDLPKAAAEALVASGAALASGRAKVDAPVADLLNTDPAAEA